MLFEIGTERSRPGKKGADATFVHLAQDGDSLAGHGRQLIEIVLGAFAAFEGASLCFGNYDQIAAALREGTADYLFGATTKPASIITDIGNGSRNS